MFKGGGRDFEKIYYRRHGKTMGGFKKKEVPKLLGFLFFMKINKFERVTTRRKSFQKFNTKFEREKKILAKGKEVFKRKDFWKRNFKCPLLKSNKVFDENQIKILECHSPRVGRPYSRTQRERCVRLPLPPRTRPRYGSLC